MLAIKSNTRYRFKTKRVKYTAIWKKSIKIVKESKLSFLEMRRRRRENNKNEEEVEEEEGKQKK